VGGVQFITGKTQVPLNTGSVGVEVQKVRTLLLYTIRQAKLVNRVRINKDDVEDKKKIYGKFFAQIITLV
jgi:hypothetical protein